MWNVHRNSILNVESTVISNADQSFLTMIGNALSPDL